MRRSPLPLVVLAWAVVGPAWASNHEHDVAIRDNQFQPASLTVAPGETVRWTNRDLVNHTVTADNGSFDSQPMLATEDWDQTFTTAGRYPYHCEVHPSMKGVVVVRTAAASTTSSSTTTTSRRPPSTLPPGGSAVTAPGETTTTTVAETTTTVAETTSTTTSDEVAAAPEDGGDDTSTGIAAAIASLLLLGVSGGALALVRKGA